MHKFYLVLSDKQGNGLAQITRHTTYADAYGMARKKAQQFPDTAFFVAEAQTAVVCPPSEVISYNLVSGVREIA